MPSRRRSAGAIGPSGAWPPQLRRVRRPSLTRPLALCPSCVFRGPAVPARVPTIGRVPPATSARSKHAKGTRQQQQAGRLYRDVYRCRRRRRRRSRLWPLSARSAPSLLEPAAGRCVMHEPTADGGREWALSAGFHRPSRPPLSETLNVFNGPRSGPEKSVYFERGWKTLIVRECSPVGRVRALHYGRLKVERYSPRSCVISWAFVRFFSLVAPSYGCPGATQKLLIDHAHPARSRATVLPHSAIFTIDVRCPRRFYSNGPIDGRRACCAFGSASRDERQVAVSKINAPMYHGRRRREWTP